MNGIDWPTVGLILSISAVTLLAGAALGYFTASTDVKLEKARAWDRGRDDAARTSRDVDAVARIINLSNPYRRPLAPEPPHHMIPNPPRSQFFDQGAAPENSER